MQTCIDSFVFLKSLICLQAIQLKPDVYKDCKGRHALFSRFLKNRSFPGSYRVIKTTYTYLYIIVYIC